MKPLVAAVMLCAGLAGCAAVGPDYAGPPASTADLTAAFASAQEGADSAVSAAAPPVQWWRQLADPALDALMDQALAANYELRVAGANVAAARALLAEVDTRKRPTVDGNARAQAQRNASAQFPGADPDRRQPNLVGASGSLDLAWELDLFGRVRRSIEAASAELGSAEALRNAVMTAVLADVARAYIDLRGAQMRLAVALRNVEVQRQTLDLVTVLNAEGAATELDVARARTQLLNSQATMPRLRADAVAALNRLTTLTAQAPGALSAGLATPRPLPVLPEFLTTGSPVELLRRRADIQAAERALAAASARIGVATAELFPTVSFTGRVGVGAAQLSDLTAAGAPFFALGPTITWNLFDRGAIHARIRQADAGAAARLARYEATVTTALEETDSALNAWLNERVRREQLRQANTTSEEASRLARLRYREGVEDFLTVLDAERNQLAVEDQLALSEIEVAQTLIDIHRALGGGWETPPAGGGALP